MDPITLSLIGSAVGQGIQALGQGSAAKREKEFFEGLQSSGEKQAKSLEKQRAGMYGMGPTMRKYLQYAMQDPTADFQRQEAQRQSGTAIGALKAGGARALLGGLGAQQQQAASTMAQIGADEYGRKTGAMAKVGQMEERLRQEQRGDIGNDLLMARQQAAQGLAGAFGAEQARRQAGTDFFSGLASTAGQIAGAEFGKPTEAGDIFRSTTGGLSDLEANNLLAKFGYGSGIDVSGLSKTVAGLPGIQGYKPNENGGKVKKTPGQFSHRKNPIDVMQNGAKIGELTGGEYVLNPEQAAAISRQSDIARKLFRKFDKEQSA